MLFPWYIGFSNPLWSISGRTKWVKPFVPLIFGCSLGLAQITLGKPALESGFSTRPTLSFPLPAQAGTSPIWDIAESPQHVVFFAAENGLHRFDGEEWQYNRFSFITGLKSVAFTAAGDMLLGGTGSFGYVPFPYSEEEFVDLSRLLEEKQPRPLIWKSMEFGGDYFFFSREAAYVWSDGKLEVHALPTERRLLPHLVNDTLYVHQRGVGLLRWTGTNFEVLVPTAPDFSVGIVYLEKASAANSLSGLLADGKQVSFSLDGPSVTMSTGVSEFENQIVFTGLRITDSLLAFSTLSNGIILTDNLSAPTAVISSSNGLPASPPYSICRDFHGNLWVGTAAGIGYIYGVKTCDLYDASTGLPETPIYDLLLHEDRLLIAGHEGVHELKLDGEDASFVSRGPFPDWTWSMYPIASDILLSTPSGIRSLDSGDSRLPTRTDAAQIIKSHLKPEEAYILQYGNALRINLKRPISVLGEVGRSNEIVHSILELSKNEILVGTLQNGAYSTLLAGDANRPRIKGVGLEHVSWVRFHQLNEEVIAVTSDGVFLFDYSNERFSKVREIDLEFGSDAYAVNTTTFEDSLYLISPSMDSSSFPSGFQLCVVTLNKGELILQTLHRPELATMRTIHDIEVFRADQKTLLIFVSGVGKVLRMNSVGEQPIEARNPAPHLTLATYRGGNLYSMLDSGTENINSQSTLSPDVDRFRFRYSSASPLPLQKSYQTFLEGYDEDWQPVTTEAFREFTNMAPGKYRFFVRAFSVDGVPPSQSSLVFHVLPYWYQTWWSRGLFLIIFFALILAFIKLRVYSLQRSNRKLEEAVALRTIELETANLDLFRANQARKNLLSTVVHEIRNPLNGVLGLSQVIRDRAKDSTVEPYLKQLDEVSSHLKEMVSELLNLSALQAGVIPSGESVLSLQPFFDEVTASYKRLADEKNLRFLSRFLGEKALRASINPGLLRQVVGNLLGNAIKFTEAGEISFIMSANRSGNVGDLQLVITDSGPGLVAYKLSTSSIDKLSEAVAKPAEISSVVDTPRNGLGLGLTIVGEAIRVLGGRFHVRSSPADGCEWRLIIPFRVQEKEPLTNAKESYKLVSTCSVLVIEDDKYNRIYVGEVLDNLGVQATCVATGFEAIAAFEKSRFDVVLCDLNLPDMSGFEVLSLLASQKRGSKKAHLVAMTADEQIQSQGYASIPELDGHLLKPFSSDKLMETMLSFGYLKKHLSDDDTDQNADRAPNVLDALSILAGQDRAKAGQIRKEIVKYMNAEISKAQHLVEERNCSQAAFILHKLLTSSKILGDEKTTKLLQQSYQKARQEDPSITNELRLIQSFLYALDQRTSDGEEGHDAV
ncbi:MAG: response regulator [Opitutales bacterium]